MSPAMLLATEDAARAAGASLGRLLFLVLGIVLLVLGLRQRKNASTPSRGTAMIVAGAFLLLLFVVGLAGPAANNVSA